MLSLLLILFELTRFVDMFTRPRTAVIISTLAKHARFSTTLRPGTRSIQPITSEHSQHPTGRKTAVPFSASIPAD